MAEINTIAAHQLRIGNQVQMKKAQGCHKSGDIVTVSSILTKGINPWQDMGASGCIEWNCLVGVPLNDEVLFGMGFQKRENSIYHPNYATTIKILPPGGPDMGYGFFIQGRHIVSLRTVHHFQNFWLDVTGELLTLDKTKSI